jgi:ubiquitin carboxyl-terminal hydrolase 8
MKTQSFPENVKQSAYLAFCRPGEKNIVLSGFLSTICTALRSGTKRSLEFVFKVFDIDHDKELSVDEFGLFVKYTIESTEIKTEAMNLNKFVKVFSKVANITQILSPFALVPTVAGELETFEKYQTSLQRAEDGTELWVTSSQWLRTWRAFVDESNKTSPLPPNYIDNYSLYLPNTTELKPGLEENRDYELLTKKAWTEMVKQYNGGPEIMRRMISLGSKLEVELYPPVMNFYKSGSLTEKVDLTSKKKLILTCKNTLEEALNKFKTEAGIAGQTLLRRSKNNVIWEDLTDLTVLLSELKPKSSEAYLVIPINRSKISKLSSTVGGSSYSTNGLSSNKSGSPTSKLQLTGFKRLPTGPGHVGLFNAGLNCYMNCVVQCLAHILPIRAVFLDTDLLPQTQSSNKIILSLERLFAELWQSDKQYISPTSFSKAFKQSHPRFVFGEQHDSHDFLAMLLELVHEDLKPHSQTDSAIVEIANASQPEVHQLGEKYWAYMRENGSPISNICAGLMKIRLTCSNCSQDKSRFEEALYLSVACEGSSRVPITLHECLRAHFSEDQFEAQCDKCSVTGPHSMRIRLCNTPQVLIICLKRFAAQSGRVSKIDREIQFPTTGLDLSKLVVGHQASLYDLAAVVNHFGTINHGHYTAACKIEESWVNFDDEVVTKTGDDASLWAQSAYILFYQLRS